MASSNDAFQISFTESPSVKQLMDCENRQEQFVRRSPRFNEQHQGTSEKENGIRARAIVGCKRFTKVSVEDLGQVIRDAKITANKTFNSVCSSVISLPQRLRRSTRRRAFTELQNENTPVAKAKSPVAMYSPFGIETPKKQRVGERRYNPRKFEFSSPTGKLKKDIKVLASGMNEFEAIGIRMSKRHFK